MPAWALKDKVRQEDPSLSSLGTVEISAATFLLSPKNNSPAWLKIQAGLIHIYFPSYFKAFT
ncbi:MAG: hypothetical protein AAFV78_14040 [Bacteroidota bacterium]